MTIDQALSIIQESDYFSIRFVMVSGEERHYARARYGAPDHWSGQKQKLEINEKLGTAHRGRRKVSLMRDDGTIPMTNLANQEFKTVKWYSIIELNGEKVY